MRGIFLITLGLSTALFASFSKTGNIVTDSTTALQWQDDAIGSTMTWTEAIDHCEDLTLDTHGDWRLPNLKELTSLVDDSRVSPSIDTSIFEHTASNAYWSSTTMLVVLALRGTSSLATAVRTRTVSPVAIMCVALEQDSNLREQIGF